MKVLVTGSSGFLGKHVVPMLEECGHKLLTPSSASFDLLKQDAAAIASYLIIHEIDAIVHLAATCGGIGINKDNPGRFIYENLQMGINVLEGARQAKLKKVVLMGTVCMYPKFTPIPFKEEDIWNGYPEETNAPYGIAKKSVLEMGRAYHKQYGLDVTSLVPVNMAGEYDHFDAYSSHVIPAIIKKFEDTQKHNDSLWADDATWTLPVELWGTGTASREFLYAGDCARAIALSLEKDTGPEPINLGTGREIIIKDLTELIKRVGEYDSVVTWDASKPDGQPRRSLDVSRAKERLGWEATTDLEETIRRSIEWYRANESSSN